MATNVKKDVEQPYRILWYAFFPEPSTAKPDRKLESSTIGNSGRITPRQQEQIKISSNQVLVTISAIYASSPGGTICFPEGSFSSASILDVGEPAGSSHKRIEGNLQANFRGRNTSSSLSEDGRCGRAPDYSQCWTLLSLWSRINPSTEEGRMLENAIQLRAEAHFFI
ncbi:hypothetical protein DAPPUDRAFT_103741 [Daphnia pulex]|uniref:Uncharacterized protein n=1 Tax=Daphnia pulex TaxID=6669 RepID=E9GK12_DAPPU|nr:hypothetical protein DAPPUDRAFT_103741 [Daphnia pulex]|eukprot:EFX80217.1 hypothetical protein DAPPUDRAFT_103741 [Daphnia pulex]